MTMRPSASVLVTSVVRAAVVPDDVAGAVGRAGQVVLRARHQAGHPHVRRDPCDGLDRGDHRGAAGHVGAHQMHAVGGLHRDAAGVEGDALAHEHHVRRTAATPVELDEPRWPGRSAAHGEHAAEALFGKPVVVAHGGVDAGRAAGGPGGRAREPGRVLDVRRSVGKITGQPGRRGQHGRAVRRIGQFGGAFRCHEPDPARARLVGLAADHEAVAAQPQSPHQPGELLLVDVRRHLHLEVLLRRRAVVVRAGRCVP